MTAPANERGTTLTGKLEPYEATIDASAGGTEFVITVKSEDGSPGADYGCGPAVDLALTSEIGTIRVTAWESLDEEDTLALIDALTKALERSRAYAKARGYYDWVAEGKPDYDTFADEETDRT